MTDRLRANRSQCDPSRGPLGLFFVLLGPIAAFMGIAAGAEGNLRPYRNPQLPRNVVKKPLQLDAGEINVDDQTGSRLYERAVDCLRKAMQIG